MGPCIFFSVFLLLSFLFSLQDEICCFSFFSFQKRIFTNYLHYFLYLLRYGKLYFWWWCKGEYKTVTSTTEVASTKETLASLAVLCFCSENTSQPQPSSISKPPYLSSSWCLTVIESGLSGSQLDSILLIVSQLKLPRCDSSSSWPSFLADAPLPQKKKPLEKKLLTLTFFRSLNFSIILNLIPILFKSADCSSILSPKFQICIFAHVICKWIHE